MKPLVAKEQVRLSWSRCFRIALTDMGYRIFRATITVAILGLAVAFLVHVVSYALLSGEIRGEAQHELSRQRELGRYLSRFSTPDSSVSIRKSLVEGQPPRLAEYRRFGKLSEQELNSAQATARSLESVATALRELPSQAQAALVADQSDEELFEAMASPPQLDRFKSTLASLKVRLPLNGLSLESLLLERRPELERAVERIAAGHAIAVERLKQGLAGTAVEVRASTPSKRFGALVRSAGFSFEDSELEPVAGFATRLLTRRSVAERVLSPDVRAAVARELKVPAVEVGIPHLVEAVDGRERAEWLSGVLAAGDGGVKVDAGRLLAMFEGARREQALAEAVGSEAFSKERGFAGIGGRDQLLIALSFLVCVVGVANAMLMSVTERFTEIATMKCLGAMDRFVMTMFVFEALIQGAVGGAAGALLGLLLALFRALAEFGALLGNAAGATLDLFAAVGVSLVAGLVLAALAAVGPAFVAARLAPMEAMRVD